MFSHKMLRLIRPRENLRRLARTLLPLVAFVVLSAIALIHPTAAWTSIALSAGAIVPLGMIVAACYGAAACRPFRAGFAIAAGNYFVFFTLFPSNSWQENFPTSKTIGFSYKKLFPSSQVDPVTGYYGGFGGFGGGGFGGGGAFFVADDADSSKDSGDADPNVNPFGVRANSSFNSNSNATSSSANTAAALALQNQQDEIAAAHNFWIIGHSVWALIFGWVGGGWAWFLAKRQKGNGEGEGVGRGAAITHERMATFFTMKQSSQ
jgi:hypothetical protein